MRNLQEHPGAIAGQRIAAASAPMSQVVQHPQTLEHDVVRPFALDADDEADAAGVMLVRGIIEALCWWNGAEDLHRHALFVSPIAFFTMT